jgi:hypothetical protein
MGLLFQTLPPYLLFELSVLVAGIAERRAARRIARAESQF